MVAGSTPAKGGPRGIAVDDVVRAGVALTAEQGLQALTVRAVAARLGVRSPSLYHHLPGGVEELRGLVVLEIQRILDAEDPAPEGASTWERLEAPLRAVGRANASYPGVLEHILTAGRDGPKRHAPRSGHVLLHVRAGARGAAGPSGGPGRRS